MIVRPKPTFWGVVFTLKGSIAQHIAIRLLAITALAFGVTLLSFRHPELFQRLGAAPFTLIGLSLSIFMSFRNNACYDRWWEGRKQWGQLVVEVRSFARESQAFAHDPARVPMLRALCGFSHALAARLRDASEIAVAKPWLPLGADLQAAPNITNAILATVGRDCVDLASRGVVSEWRYTMLEARLVSMSGIQAACERIKGTPLPFAYMLLLHRTAYLFCCLLPFGIAQPLGWATPLVTAIVSYTFFGLDALGDELEEPFGYEVNDLPLDALVRIMERDIRFALGETDLPPPLEPVDYLLR
jgi:putative membrane protein